MAEAPERFPRAETIGDLEISLSLMGPDDREAVLGFAGGLPRHDLLFLRRDISRPETVDVWLAEIATGQIHTVLARVEEAVIGYGTLDRSTLDWSRHVAELRVVVSEEGRGKGIGGFLTREVFALALTLEVEKIVARMTLDQKGAMKTFEGLGFRPEALLRDHVKDANGVTHDLVTMSHSVAEFHRTLEAYGVPSNVDASQ